MLPKAGALMNKDAKSNSNQRVSSKVIPVTKSSAKDLKKLSNKNVLPLPTDDRPHPFADSRDKLPSLIVKAGALKAANVIKAHSMAVSG